MTTIRPVSSGGGGDHEIVGATGGPERRTAASKRACSVAILRSYGDHRDGRSSSLHKGRFARPAATVSDLDAEQQFRRGDGSDGRR